MVDLGGGVSEFLLIDMKSISGGIYIIVEKDDKERVLETTGIIKSNKFWTLNKLVAPIGYDIDGAPKK